MTPSLLRRWTVASPESLRRSRGFRSKAALEALEKASVEKTPTVALYNYPSFSGAFSALFAHIFHSHLRLPCLILPFSSVEPLRVDDLCIEGLKECYFLDFLGPRGFAAQLSHQSSCKVIGFDHKKSILSTVSCDPGCSGNVSFQVDLDKSSSTAAYEYFSSKLLVAESSEIKFLNSIYDWVGCCLSAFLPGPLVWTWEEATPYSPQSASVGNLSVVGDEKGEMKYILNPEQRDRLELVLKYIEDTDLRRWSLPNIKAFNLALGEYRPMLNCITNPHMYEQLLAISSLDLIGKGNSLMSIRQDAARNLLDKVFKVHLGRGFYGDCLGVRADGNSNLTDELAKELSLKSAAAGLRETMMHGHGQGHGFSKKWEHGHVRGHTTCIFVPIGAVIYMQRNNLKMCLRSTDAATDTSEVAKAYGGGGSPSSSSFIIRMDEYNQWLSVNQP